MLMEKKPIIFNKITKSKVFKNLNPAAYAYRTNRLPAGILKAIVRSEKALIIRIYISNNNVFLVVCRPNGYMFFSTSAGTTGIRGPKKFTEQTIKLMMDRLITKYVWLKRAKFIVVISGPIKNLLVRRCLRSLQEFNFNIERIYFSTSSVHNGCRQRKQRRV
jgi:ribosomal protein S11